MLICGKKVRLRPIEESDLALMVQWFNDPEIAQLVGGWDFPISLAQQKEWYRSSLSDRRTQRWIIEDFEGNPLGLTGLWDIDWHNRQALNAVKLGNTDMRGKGYGTDVIMTVMAYSFFQVGLNRLWGEIIDYNIGSYMAYVKNCGWKVEGKLRESVFRDGVYHDQYRVAILKDEFIALDGVNDYIPSQEKRKIATNLQQWAVLD
jgi:RimJ/RimL family protein N-acetyltransferase